MRILVVLTCLLAAGMVVAGGIAWFRHAKCSGLEEDVLNAASAERAGVAISSLADRDGDLAASAAALEEIRDREMEEAISAIAAECGVRAMNTAVRKAAQSAGI